MTPLGIHQIGNMIGRDGVATITNDGRIVRAVPSPYYVLSIRERFRAAWWVMTHRALAVQWPEPGELERAIGKRPS